MPERRRVVGMKRSLVVAIPPVIAEQLGLVRGSEVWWHLPWKDEATLTRAPVRVRGYPDAVPLLRELTAARAEIARLQRRREDRARVLYAEGYALGFIRATMRLTPPSTPGTEREDARRRAFDAFAAEPPRRSSRVTRRTPDVGQLARAVRKLHPSSVLSEGPHSP